MAMLLFILGLLCMCVFWPFGLLLWFAAIVWAIVFRRPTVIVVDPLGQPVAQRQRDQSPTVWAWALGCIGMMLTVLVWLGLDSMRSLSQYQPTASSPTRVTPSSMATTLPVPGKRDMRTVSEDGKPLIVNWPGVPFSNKNDRTR